jgi:broad specificity phosphatase PhoE
MRATLPGTPGTVACVTRLLLVRHGESEWNAIGRWQGWADPPLSELGELQAAVASKAVGAVDAIVASDLQRAHRTAEIIAHQLGVGPVIVDASLRERDAGPWTGMTRVEIEGEWPGYLASGKRPDGYEEDEALLDRVTPSLRTLEAAGEAVLVVTHGGVIGAVERWLGAEHQRTPNLGGRIVDVVDGKVRLGEPLLLVDEHDVRITAPPEV